MNSTTIIHCGKHHGSLAQHRREECAFECIGSLLLLRNTGNALPVPPTISIWISILDLDFDFDEEQVIKSATPLFSRLPEDSSTCQRALAVPVVGGQQGFAQPNRLGGDFHHFVFTDKMDGPLQGHWFDRR
jgi:hypothetical protein